MAKNSYGMSPVTDGRTRIKGLDVNWTKLEEIRKTFTFGKDIVDNDTGDIVNLPGKPTYNQPELSAPWKYETIQKFRKWLQSKDATPGKVVITTVTDNVYTTHTGCTLLSYPLNIGHDADGDQETAQYLRITVSLSNATDNKLETK